MAGTIGKAISNIITPILKPKVGSQQDEQGGDTANEIGLEGEGTELSLPQEEKQGSQGPRITETIKIEANSFFGIQLGAFNNRKMPCPLPMSSRRRVQRGMYWKISFPGFGCYIPVTRRYQGGHGTA